MSSAASNERQPYGICGDKNTELVHYLFHLEAGYPTEERNSIGGKSAQYRPRGSGLITGGGAFGMCRHRPAAVQP